MALSVLFPWPSLRHPLVWICVFVTVLVLASAPTAAEPGARVSQDLLVLYTFEKPLDSIIRDRSGVGAALDLPIEKPQGVAFRDGRLVVTSSARITSAEPAKK